MDDSKSKIFGLALHSKRVDNINNICNYLRNKYTYNHNGFHHVATIFDYRHRWFEKGINWRKFE